MIDHWSQVEDPDTPLRGQPHAQNPTTVTDEIEQLEAELEDLRDLRASETWLADVRSNGLMVVVEGGIRYVEIITCHEDCEVTDG